MPLNLIKLCVGVDSLEELQSWRLEQRQARKSSGGPHHHTHVTRMVPKRAEELLNGGSLYWVIKGNVQAHQKLLDIEVFTDVDGIRRCRLVMDDEIIPTQWQAKRPFQGWRYYKSSDAPADLSQSDAEVPAQLRAELAELGLL